MKPRHFAQRAPLVATLIILAATSSRPAGATDLTVTGSVSGAAAAPWTGTLTGQLAATDYTQSGDTQLWTVEGTILADPGIPGPRWPETFGDSVHAMWRLIKYLVDLSAPPQYPEQPTILGALTGYSYAVSLTTSHADYGIAARCDALVNGEGPVTCSANLEVQVESPFPECVGHYLLSGTVFPAGPGAAEMSGAVALTLADGTQLDLPIQARYTFDPALVLENAFHVTQEAWYEITDADAQVLHVQETHSETWMGATSVEATNSTWGAMKVRILR